MSNAQPSTLPDKIERRAATVAVIGLGYVGLPLAVAFAEAGFRVIGIDIDVERVACLNAGHSYVSDVPSERLAPLVASANSEQLSVNSDQLAVNPKFAIRNSQSAIRNPQFLATTDYDVLHDADAAIICVPTPLSKTKDPNMSYIISATDEIARRLHRDMLVVLESTTYPGTTEELILPRLQMEGGEGKGEGGKWKREKGEKGEWKGEGGKGRRDKGKKRERYKGEQRGDGHGLAIAPQAGSPVAGQRLVVGRDFFLAFRRSGLIRGGRIGLFTTRPR